MIPKLGWLEGILNTPSHHRVHHAMEEQYIDKNYGGILIIFDRMFGTYAVEEKGIPCTYGLIGKPKTLNPFRVLFQEWVAIAKDVAQAKSFRDLALATFGRPGAFAARKQSEKLDKQAIARQQSEHKSIQGF